MKNKHKTVAIYARVSTDKQKVDMQLRELRSFVKRSGWKIYNEFIDHGFTGANTNRPAFNAMMDDAKKRKFDVLLIWKLDRLSRSMKDLINTLDELDHYGINFISYDNNLDTTTPTGKLVFHVIGAVAEFEKDIIRDRVIAGLTHAKSKGKRLGRPPLSQGTLTEAKKLLKEGLSMRAVERKLGLGEGTIRKKLKS